MSFVFRRPRAAVGAVVASFALAGCVAYEPQPLDLDAARAEFLTRSAADPSVVAFAARLGAEGGASTPGFDPKDGLNAAEAEVVALFFNPALRRLRRSAAITAAGAAEAGRWEDPVLGVDGARIVESVDDPWVLGGTLGLTLPLSGRLGAEEGVATAEHRAAEVAVVGEEWRVRMEVRRRLFAWTAEGLRVDVLRDHLKRLDAASAVVAKLEASSELPRLEARLFPLERAARNADLRGVEARLAEARLALLAVCGLAPEAPQSFVSGLAATPPAEDHDARRSRAEARNPLLMAARAAHDVAEEALRLETRKQYPDLAATFGFGEDEGIARVLFSGGVPLPIWNANRRGIAEATARREAARNDAYVALEVVHAELAAAEVRLAAATGLRAELSDAVAPLVDAQMADVVRTAELGRFNALVLLETLSRLRETKLRLIDARLDEALAAVALEEALGPPGASQIGAPTALPSAASRPAAEEPRR